MDTHDDSPADNPSEDSSTDSFENELCIHCLQPNAPLVKFCRHCRAPVHSLAAWNPYERVHATGFIWRTAASKPHSAAVLIGIYLYFLPTFLFSAFMLRATLQGQYFQYTPRLYLLITLTPVTVYAILCLLMMSRTTVNYFTSKQK